MPTRLLTNTFSIVKRRHFSATLPALTTVQKSSMTVPVMGVGKMFMYMRQSLVLVPVHVRFSGRVIRRMVVLMMFIMAVQMFVFVFLMSVFVLMMLAYVQPDSYTHQNRGKEQISCHRFVQ